MYGRVVLSLYRSGQGRTAGALTPSRYTDHFLKCFSLGSVHCSEKTPPETHASSTPPAEDKKPPETLVSCTPLAEDKSPENLASSTLPAEDKKPPETLVSCTPPAEDKKSPENLASSTLPAEGKKPPENFASSTLPAEEKSDKKDSPQPPKRHSLMDLISGMNVKVELTSKKTFLAKKMEKNKKQKRGRSEGLESTSRMFQMASGGDQTEKEKEVDSKMEAAVSAVASTFPGKKNQVESELLQQLRIHKQMAAAQRNGDLNLSNVLSGMQIKRQPKLFQKTQKEDAHKQIFGKGHQKSFQILFTGKRLTLFPISPESEQTAITVAESSPTLWDIELAKEIATACELPPRNGFEEMIQWTNDGKLWTFPIDNEAGLDEEQNVEFHEHVFLEKYLEEFPRQGPIRHFMELVICGLSKNPYLTVQQKKEHIDWFQDYFNQKEDVLRECEV